MFIFEVDIWGFLISFKRMHAILYCTFPIYCSYLRSTMVNLNAVRCEKVKLKISCDASMLEAFNRNSEVYPRGEL